MLSRFTLLTLAAGLCFGQEAPHEITLDAQTLARYAGAYQMPSGANMLVTVENDQVFTKLGSQRPLPIFPESKTMFFAKVVNAKIEFAKDDDKGRPTELILHQGGRDQVAKRLDDATAKKISDAAVDFARRLKDQTAAAGSAAALRKMVEDVAAGKPDYDSMSPGLANATRQQLPQIQAQMNQFGKLQSIVFTGVGPAGPDIYSVRFEKGALEYRVWLGVDGKIESANAHPVELPAAATSLRPRIPDIDAMVAAELARRRVGSVTVGVVAGKELIWSKSYGDADMEKKIAADTDTVYRIGSVTKMFTALMLEQLVEAGKVHLSDPVEKYFPEVNMVKGRFADAPPITFMQLATHTSGLGREPEDMSYLTGPVSNWEKILISALPHLSYDFEPGTRYSYSNMGYAVLGAALSRAAGESYVDYVPKHILQPLGMTSSSLDRNPAMMVHLSKGYQVTGPSTVDAEIAQREHETGRGYKVPNGAMYTTVSDLSRFASFLMGEGPENVLKKASLQRFQAQSIVPGDVTLNFGYGIGFSVDRRDGYVAFGHGGSVAGYTAMLLINRAKGVGVVALSNGAANPSVISEKALDMLSK